MYVHIYIHRWKILTTLIFKEKGQFLAENWRKSSKKCSDHKVTVIIHDIVSYKLKEKLSFESIESLAYSKNALLL
jgi:hypothetical protein